MRRQKFARENCPLLFCTLIAFLLMLPSAALHAQAVRLRYHRVNQAERWQSLEMNGEGSTFQAMIPPRIHSRRSRSNIHSNCGQPVRTRRSIRALTRSLPTSRILSSPEGNAARL